MLIWNEKADGAVFSPNRLAPELPAFAQTPADDFPVYFISDDAPMPPSAVLTLAQLRRMPRTEMRVRHCLEEWSAVASWHGVRLSEITRLARPDPRVRFSSDANRRLLGGSGLRMVRRRLITATALRARPLINSH